MQILNVVSYQLAIRGSSPMNMETVSVQVVSFLSSLTRAWYVRVDACICKTFLVQMQMVDV